MKIRNVVLAGALVLVLGNAQAALFDRGGGLLYDDVLKVTWLQDANYASTQFAATGGAQGDADGRMNWTAAKTWAAGLAYGGYDDWRLAANTPVGADWNYNFSFDGSTDGGYNVTSPHSEMGYMYYVNLGLKGDLSPAGVYQADFGVFGNGTEGGQANVGLVKNLQSYIYWSGTAYAPFPANDAWVFGNSNGFQDNRNQGNVFYAWAVRDGDVAAPVPEPETYAMMLAGLGLLGLMTRRRKQKLPA